MNPGTGHLVDLEKIDLEKWDKELKEAGYVPIPPNLQNAAIKKLAGKPEAFVSRNSGGKLSRFAAHQRRMQKGTYRNKT
ncbi:hypothetical protein ES705_34062 [subsurface metagenome]